MSLAMNEFNIKHLNPNDFYNEKPDTEDSPDWSIKISIPQQLETSLFKRLVLDTDSKGKKEFETWLDSKFEFNGEMFRFKNFSEADLNKMEEGFKKWYNIKEIAEYSDEFLQKFCIYLDHTEQLDKSFRICTHLFYKSPTQRNFFIFILSFLKYDENECLKSLGMLKNIGLPFSDLISILGIAFCKKGIAKELKKNIIEFFNLDLFKDNNVMQALIEQEINRAPKNYKYSTLLQNILLGHLKELQTIDFSLIAPQENIQLFLILLVTYRYYSGEIPIDNIQAILNFIPSHFPKHFIAKKMDHVPVSVLEGIEIAKKLREANDNQ